MHASTIECPTGMVPEGAKLIHQRLAKRGDLRVDEPIWHASAESISDVGEAMVLQFGIPREPLDSAERAIKCGLPPHMQSLMKTKRLLLFKEMLESFDYPDKPLISDLSEGFSITGWQNKTGVFRSV